jgi:hypothetical protein
MSIGKAGELVALAEKQERKNLVRFFRKIQTAAYDGQNGSSTYAFDRLAFIQALATAAIAKIENETALPRAER